MVSFRGKKKSLCHAQIGLLYWGLIQNFRRASPPLSYAESPPGPRALPTDVKMGSALLIASL